MTKVIRFLALVLVFGATGAAAQQCPLKWTTTGNFTNTNSTQVTLPICPLHRAAPYCVGSDTDRPQSLELSLDQDATHLTVRNKIVSEDGYEVACTWSNTPPAAPITKLKQQRPWVVYPRECIDEVSMTEKTELIVPLDAKGKEHPEQARVLSTLVKYQKNCTKTHYAVIGDRGGQ